MKLLIVGARIDTTCENQDDAHHLGTQEWDFSHRDAAQGENESRRVEEEQVPLVQRGPVLIGVANCYGRATVRPAGRRHRDVDAGQGTLLEVRFFVTTLLK